MSSTRFTAFDSWTRSTSGWSRPEDTLSVVRHRRDVPGQPRIAVGDLVDLVVQGRGLAVQAGRVDRELPLHDAARPGRRSAASRRVSPGSAMTAPTQIAPVAGVGSSGGRRAAADRSSRTRNPGRWARRSRSRRARPRSLSRPIGVEGTPIGSREPGLSPNRLAVCGVTTTPGGRSPRSCVGVGARCGIRHAAGHQPQVPGQRVPVGDLQLRRGCRPELAGDGHVVQAGVWPPSRPTAGPGAAGRRRSRGAAGW